MRLMSALLITLLILSMLTALGAAPNGSEFERSSSLALFDERILPIFRSSDPSSCVQCHLASVDLKDYILPSEEKTFVSLRDQGLIDLEAPEKSKILKLIQMGTEDPDEGARLIHEEMRRAEYEAFAAWIKACCNEPRLIALPCLESHEEARPAKPDAVIRHARKDRVLDSFVRNVWSQRMRCFPCHAHHEIDETNPRHKNAIKKLGEFRIQYGEEMFERLNIFRETPEASMEYLISSSRNTPDDRLPLINLENPTQSLLVLKPTSKLPAKLEDGTHAAPSLVDPVSHMGGLKMHLNDASYKSFIAWIQDYARVVGDRYDSAAELPADNLYPSKQVLRVMDTPADWAAGTTVQFFVHAWDADEQGWRKEAAAFTQGTVNPRHRVVGPLFLLAGKQSEASMHWDGENAKLPAGRYLVKAFVDAHHRLATDPTAYLDDTDFYGRVEVPDAQWRETFKLAESISGADFVRD